MSDVSELIVEARDYAGADEYPGAEFLRAVADALEAERAEAERDDAEADLERLRGDLAKMEYERGIFESSDLTARRENARLTAQLQAVREYVDEHEHPDDWNVLCVYTDGLRAILDAAADGGK